MRSNGTKSSAKPNGFHCRNYRENQPDRARLFVRFGQVFVISQTYRHRIRFQVETRRTITLTGMNDRERVGETAAV